MNRSRTNLSRFKNADQAFGAPGSVVIEVIIVIPLILLVAFASIEISRILEIAQVASVMSRESANLIFRNCSDFNESSESPDDDVRKALTAQVTDRCLAEVLSSDSAVGLQKYANDLLGANNLSIIISVYRYDSRLSPPLWRIAVFGETESRLSKFNIDSDVITNGTVTISATEIEARERIVVAEVYHTYRPITGLVPFAREFDLYEVTIL